MRTFVTRVPRSSSDARLAVATSKQPIPANTRPSPVSDRRKRRPSGSADVVRIGSECVGALLLRAGRRQLDDALRRVRLASRVSALPLAVKKAIGGKILSNQRVKTGRCRMNNEFIRHKTSARGSLTPAEREKVDELLRLWARRGSRTTPINPGKIVRAITGIYKAAGLKRPHIAIAASPLALAFAYGAALSAWDARNARINPSLDCEKSDPVLTALERMTTVIARGDGRTRCSMRVAEGGRRQRLFMPGSCSSRRSKKRTALSGPSPIRDTGEVFTLRGLLSTDRSVRASGFAPRGSMIGP